MIPQIVIIAMFLLAITTCRCIGGALAIRVPAPSSPIPVPPPPESELSKCLNDCCSKVSSCIIGCTEETLQVPLCVANCENDNLSCLFSCVHIPFPTPTNIFAQLRG